MSKIGKKAILIPKGVTVSINENNVDIKGPKGNKKIDLDAKDFEINVNKNSELLIKPRKKNGELKKMWGTNRSLLNNSIIGVHNGYEKILVMTGVGYRAAIKENNLNLQLGFSHDINFEIPHDVKISVEKQTTIKINGSNKQLVGSIASKIKSFRPTEPYKGKGIKEKNEYVLRKEGKKK